MPEPAWLLPLLAYALGSIPFGLLLARGVAGRDIRQEGSGNIGASNVARVVGKKLGVVTLVFDAAKGFFPVWVALDMLPVPSSWTSISGNSHLFFAGVVGLCAVVGHCFSLWLRLRGGKGVATGFGVLLALHPVVAACGIVVFALVYGVWRTASLASLSACAAVVLALLWQGPRDLSLLPLMLCFAIVVAKHHANIRRLRTHQELQV